MWQSKHKYCEHVVQCAEMFTMQTMRLDNVYNVMYSVYSENKQSGLASKKILARQARDKKNKRNYVKFQGPATGSKGGHHEKN